MSDATIADRVREALSGHPTVNTVELVGSRARGQAQVLSDWDFTVETSDFERLSQNIGALVASLEPIAAFWDPLSAHECYMFILRGAKKVDLLFDVPHAEEPPWVLSAETFPHIDTHFWDWSLWLGAKVMGGQEALVRSELEKMSWFLLEPIGADEVPRDLAAAIETYIDRRSALETTYGTRLDRTLGDEVNNALRTNGVL